MNIWTQVTNSKTYISNTYSILCCYQNMKKMILPLHTEIKHQNLRDRLKDFPSGGEGDDRGWDGWMASLTWWTWVWVNSRSWWWTGRPGVLRFMGLQRVGHDWATELNWTEMTQGKVGVRERWLDSFRIGADHTHMTRWLEILASVPYSIHHWRAVWGWRLSLFTNGH